MLNNTNKTRIFYTGLFVVVAIGIWLRLKGLGKWPLAVDEYYIVKSIEKLDPGEISAKSS